MEMQMKKSFLLLLLLLSVGLAGCLPQAIASPTSAPTATTAAMPTPTTSLIVPLESEILPDAGCTVIAREPTPGPTAESIYPPVGDADHVKGPADAKVTIIEYSDFQ
jgi:hypothetical protein